jgi:hypothetical protein
MEPRFRSLFEHLGQGVVDIGYAGRDISASTATGHGVKHST